MAIQKEIWAADIKEKLFPDNSFVMLSQDDSAFSDGKKVHRAIAGDVDKSTRNRSVVPAPIKRRTDIDSEYDLDEFTTDPMLIQDIEEVEVNYNKRQSVLSQHTRRLNLDIANWMQYNWAPSLAATFVRTSGANRNAIADSFGATGTRKKITIADIIAAVTLLDDMETPEDGRTMLLPSAMYNDLMNDNWQHIVNLQAEGKAVLSNGNLMSLFGLKLLKRGKKNLLTYTNAATPVARNPDAANLTTANAAALIWHPDFVTRAKGDVKVFENIDDATLYGSAFSALARAGGRQLYNDGSGVVALIEAA